MHQAFPLILAALLLFSSCGGGRLTHAEIRRQIADLGTSTLTPKAVQVQRVVSQSGNSAIAETSVELTFEFERDFAGSPWRIKAVRLGDQNWVSVPELVAVIEESRKRETAASLRKLDAGVAAYRQRNASLPAAAGISTLADLLHPQYMSDLILEDAWGRPIELESAAGVLRFRSLGPDGNRATADDMVFPE